MASSGERNGGSGRGRRVIPNPASTTPARRAGYRLPETPPPTPSRAVKPSSSPTSKMPNVTHVDRSPEIPVAMSPRSMTFPKRPGYGKEGRSIELVANYFQVTLPSGLLYHYDVNISSVRVSGDVQPVISKACKRQVFQLLVRSYKHELDGNLPVFDGMCNSYTRRPLGFQTKTFNVAMDEEGRPPSNFVVRIQHASTLDMSHLQAVYTGKLTEVPQPVIQALDIILRYGPSTVHSSVGVSIFRAPSDHHDTIGGGLQLWQGYRASVRPCQWKPLINVNVVATAFYEEGNLLDLVCKILGDRRGSLDPCKLRKLTDSQVAKLNKRLRRLKVVATNLPYPRKYVIESVTRASANELSFGDPPVSVTKYFAEKYRPLKFPNLPCIEVGQRKSYIPLEVCEVIKGQHCRRKLDENQTATVIKKTAVPPAERFRSIQEATQDCISNSQQYLDHFGIRISTSPVQLQARVLAAPAVSYQDDVPVRPNNGAWELQGVKFYLPANLTKWTVLSYSNPNLCPKQAIDRFVDMIVRFGRQLGMCIEPPLAVKQCAPNNSLLATLSRENSIPGLQIVLIVVTNGIYNSIKSVGETEVGVLTQCVMDRTVTTKCNASVMLNLLQKLNAKLGGTNSTVPAMVKSVIFDRPVIVIGADVTHPAAFQNKPSIAAIVASMDRFAFRYATSFRIQTQNALVKARVEIIEDLKSAVKEMLLNFYLINRKTKPTMILFYRDGVSESQFRSVLNHELAAIRAACTDLERGYEPGITFLTVQKRHQTRFMPQSRRDGCGKSGNVPPGTTVDTDITHPIDFDFFICSQYGIQGTSRPAHYYVLWDDNNFGADVLQKLTFALCHTSSRCAKSLSIPVPVYYAHLATQRAKSYIDARMDVNDSSSGSDDSLPPTDTLQAAVTMAESLKTSMFFV